MESRKNEDGRHDFSLRIRRARRTAKLSQTALARTVGVTPSAVAQWEHPEGTLPSLARLQRIAAATQVNLEWLASGAGRYRAPTSSGEASALKLDIFAQDSIEELLLHRFRLLAPRARTTLMMFLEEVSHRRSRRKSAE
ncbi:MAG TPA: helix-turn-helix transcriptional regulator [Rudaea sp.]